MLTLTRSLLPTLNVLGAILVMFGFTMLLPLAFALIGQDAALGAYDETILITLATGGVMFGVTRRFQRELRPRDGFLLVTLVWTVLPAFGALPLLFFIHGLSFTDAYFEAMSGLTTTGSTVLTKLEELPLSLNVWRHQLVWMGGMGILVLAVAIMPMLGVGGSEVFKAESTGVLKENKLTPRIAQTAKGLYSVYFGLSAVCFISYHLVGMSWPDAFMLMCSTMGLGGFAPYDASVAYWNSPLIEYTIVLFMLLAGINFSVHFVAWRRRSFQVYRADEEGRCYLMVTLGAALAIAVFLLLRDVYGDFETSLRFALFNTVSIATTTGLVSTDYNQWPAFAPVLMLFLSCFATCAGSTGGGIKMIRALLLFKQARREFTRILHPRVVNPLSIEGHVIENNVIFAVLAFMLFYGGSIIVLTMLLIATEVDPVTAFSAVVASINNTGPGLNLVGPAANYQGLTDFQTWVCTFAMLIGRIELLAVFVVMTPMFWSR